MSSLVASDPPTPVDSVDWLYFTIVLAQKTNAVFEENRKRPRNIKRKKEGFVYSVQKKWGMHICLKQFQNNCFTSLGTHGTFYYVAAKIRLLRIAYQSHFVPLISIFGISITIGVCLVISKNHYALGFS
ncbi:hypothetical protein GQ457_07G003750 [Hibiscus cannabinus]